MKPTKLRLMLEDESVRTCALGAAVRVMEARHGYTMGGMVAAINEALDVAIRVAEARIAQGHRPQPELPQSAQDAAPSPTVVRDHDET